MIKMNKARLHSQVGYGTAPVVTINVGLMMQHHEIKMVHSGKIL